METLEKEEQRQIGVLNRWSTDQASTPTKKKKEPPPAAKPPKDPKAKLHQFKTNFNSSSKQGQGRQAMTPPPDLELKAMVRTFSDQGIGEHSGSLRVETPARPGSDSLKDRPQSGVAQSSVTDTFPGSASQRPRPPTAASTRQTPVLQKTASQSSFRNKVAPQLSAANSRANSRSGGPQDDDKKQAWSES